MSNVVTLEEFLHWAEDYFLQHDLYYGHGTDNAWDEAVMLALHVMQLNHDVDPSVLQQHLTPEELAKLKLLVTRRVQERIPVPYLIHEAWFAGERYYIDKNAIIPRSPLAELIGRHFQPWLGSYSPKRILDLCTGSGCIAIYCAKQFPAAIVDAVDIDAAALQVATKNVELHKSKINLIQSDLFAKVANHKYDIIISNPPYVNAQDMADLPAEYLHEPVLALASGEDGLQITEAILRQAKQFLTPNGLLVVEVGNSWEALATKYPELPFVWLEFANGGDGVFLLHVQDL